MKKQSIQILLLVLGITLFVFLVLKSDITALYAQFQSINAGYFIAVIIYAFLWRYLHALGFYILCGLRDTQQGAYIVTQILSNTVSDIFPVGNTGGEVYRAYKMSSYYPKHRDIFYGRTILYNTFYAFAMLLVFLTSGFYLTLVWDLPSIVESLFLVIIGLLLVLLVFLLVLQSKGMLQILLSPFLKIPMPRFQKWMSSLINRIEPIDRSMKGFYSKHPVRANIFISLMYLSRILTIGEVLLIGGALGINISFSQAVLINMVDSFIKIAFFIVPNGQLGVLEAAIMSLGRFIGESSTTMLGFSLLQRARMLVWDVIGIGIMVIERIKGGFYARKMDV